MRAFIIAGGQGTRSANPNLPKSLSMIANEPVIAHQLKELLAVDRITKITLVLGNQAEMISEWIGEFRSKIKTPKKIEIVIENSPRGSGGFLRELINGCGESSCFVVLGDIAPRGGILECFHQFETQQLSATNVVFVHPNDHPYDSDSIIRKTNLQNIETIIFKNTKQDNLPPNLSPVGFFFLNENDSSLWPEEEVLDLMQGAIPALVTKGRKVLAIDILRRSIDIGTPKRLDQVNRSIEQVGQYIDFAVFIDRDDTIIIDPNKRVRPEPEVCLINGVIPLLELLNRYGVPVVCVSNQPIIAKGIATDQDIKEQNTQVDRLLAEQGVYIDKWLYCPHHPESGFVGEIKELKKDCNCRKPNPGMLLKVASEHNISLFKSLIIGDSFRDIEIKENLIARIHYNPMGDCTIKVEHNCYESFGDILAKVKMLVEGQS